MIRLVVCMGMLLSLGCRAPKPPRTKPLIAAREAAGLHYVEVVPVGPDLDEPMPMVVFIHGLGDRPRASWIEPNAQPARYILPQAPRPHGDGYSWFPYRVGEQDPELEIHIEAAIEKLASMLKAVLTQHPTEGLPIVSGFSQGGILTFGLALRHPELVSAAHPIAGFLPKVLWPMHRKAAANPTIRAAHGTADRVIPFGPTQEMVSTLDRRGFDISLRAFPNVGHGRSSAMREMSDAFIKSAIAEVVQ